MRSLAERVELQQIDLARKRRHVMSSNINEVELNYAREEWRRCVATMDDRVGRGERENRDPRRTKQPSLSGWRIALTRATAALTSSSMTRTSAARVLEACARTLAPSAFIGSRASAEPLTSTSTSKHARARVRSAAFT
jgi:hypothetical protein